MNIKILKLLTIMSIFSLFSGCKSENSNFFLKDIDLSDANYALYIKHKEFGEFMVLDQQVIKANKGVLKIKLSFINYLPGEGNRSFGVMLFKNNKLIKSKIGGAFKSFETGNLKDFAIPVKQKRLEGTKSEILQKLDSLKSNKSRFITFQSNFVPDSTAFRFRVRFPSIALPITKVKDSSGYERTKIVNGIDIKNWQMKKETEFEKKWAKILEDRIRKKADTITNFEVSISKGSVEGAYLFDTTKKNGDLKTLDNKHSYMNTYIFYDFEAYIMTNQENSEKLIALDYSDCLSEEERNRGQIISEMKKMVKQSTSPKLDVDKGEVGLTHYRDQTTKANKVYQQTYQLNWIEIK